MGVVQLGVVQLGVVQTGVDHVSAVYFCPAQRAESARAVASRLDFNDGHWSFFSNDGMVMFFCGAPLPSMVFNGFASTEPSPLKVFSRIDH